MSVLIAMSTMSVCVAIFVMYLHTNCPSNYPPRWMSFIMFRVLARMMCMRHIPVVQKDEGDDKNMISNNGLDHRVPNTQKGRIHEITPTASEEVYKFEAILQKVIAMLRAVL